MSVTLALIVPPDYTAQPVVSLDQAKAQLNVEHGEDDDLLRVMIDAAVRHIDAGNGWLGRALRPQTWEWRAAAFPAGEIVLPYPPQIAVSSVKYLDPDGVDTTLSSSTGYRVFGLGVDTRCARIVPPYGGSWPAARCDIESVRVRFTCGYDASQVDDDDTPLPDRLPETIVQWLLLVIGTLYAHRESVTASAAGVNAIKALPPHILEMLSPLRVYS